MPSPWEPIGKDGQWYVRPLTLERAQPYIHAFGTLVDVHARSVLASGLVVTRERLQVHVERRLCGAIMKEYVALTEEQRVNLPAEVHRCVEERKPIFKYRELEVIPVKGPILGVSSPYPWRLATAVSWNKVKFITGTWFKLQLELMEHLYPLAFAKGDKVLEGGPVYTALPWNGIPENFGKTIPLGFRPHDQKERTFRVEVVRSQDLVVPIPVILPSTLDPPEWIPWCFKDGESHPVNAEIQRAWTEPAKHEPSVYSKWKRKQEEDSEW